MQYCARGSVGVFITSKLFFACKLKPKIYLVQCETLFFLHSIMCTYNRNADQYLKIMPPPNKIDPNIKPKFFFLQKNIPPPLYHQLVAALLE